MDGKRIQELLNENMQLRRENTYLRQQALRHTMERAVMDDQLSQQISNNMEPFFGDSKMAWYMCMLFHGGVPKMRSIPAESPLELIAASYELLLSSYGTPFFFETVGTVACILNLELPVEPEDPSASGERLCGEIKTAMELQHRKTKDMTNLSHISISHISSIKWAKEAVSFRGDGFRAQDAQLR